MPSFNGGAGINHRLDAAHWAARYCTSPTSALATKLLRSTAGSHSVRTVCAARAAGFQSLSALVIIFSSPHTAHIPTKAPGRFLGLRVRLKRHACARCTTALPGSAPRLSAGRYADSPPTCATATATRPRHKQAANHCGQNFSAWRHLQAQTTATYYSWRGPAWGICAMLLPGIQCTTSLPPAYSRSTPLPHADLQHGGLALYLRLTGGASPRKLVEQRHSGSFPNTLLTTAL